MPRVLLVPCKKNGPENAEAQSFQQIRPRWKLIRAERCVLASSTQWEQPRCTQGPELQEGGLALLFFQRFSCSAHEGSQYVRKHTVFVQPPLLQISAYICSWCLCWARMFSQLWHTMSFNSSPFERQWVRNGSPGASDLRYPNTLHRSRVPCGLFHWDRKERLCISFYIHNNSKNSLFPPYSDTIISCFFGMRS